jgi:hypothetical protein
METGGSRAGKVQRAGGADLSRRAKVSALNTDYNFQFARFRTRALPRESFKIESSWIAGGD